eukprot:CAMPEP_0171584006 /NCGR_PEP_ID=MMETSP0961-20121227/11143_1 /TAXON_ID=87120 /ORGANISM="Aurantiochytrium limacinum, Strain ATCCMYA-1381" /LENGTH=38 /DNA_ID= /DNA_START= /DNA_END= /DNA_ORIENTATION=
MLLLKAEEPPTLAWQAQSMEAESLWQHNGVRICFSKDQ